ncbi:MAG: quinol:electron acceptor oxidoreductase subunit ActD [Planctomycetota bacterium]
MATERFSEQADGPEWVRKLTEHDRESEQKLYGIVAEFDTPQELMAAAEKVRDAGYTKWDCLTPFAVHGLDDSMGVKPTILPWLTLGAGLSGTTIAFLLQTWTNAIDYPYLISGKPLISLPASIPIMFELTVLLAAFTTFLGMMALNFLPEWFHPLLRRTRAAGFTDDKFGIVIEASDKRFNREQVQLLLQSNGATMVESVFAPAKRAPIPGWIHAVGLSATVVALIPAGLAAKSMYVKSDKPRIHIVQDMDMQPKLKTQQPDEFFASVFGDPRASLLPVAGTVARGELRADDHYYRGGAGLTGERNAIEAERWFDGMPNGIEVDRALLERGQERYVINGSPCHGITGHGDGLVARRADRLEQGTWVPPTSLHEPRLLEQPDGQLFNTITNGKGNMKPYGHQVAVEDRWAIVSYVRALQKSRSATEAEFNQR